MRWAALRRCPEDRDRSRPPSVSTPDASPASTATSQRYVDDGRLAGWHAVVSRRGQVVHSSTYGQRDIEAGLPFERRHRRADVLHEQADHVGGGDDAARGGRLLAEGSDQHLHPRVRRHAGVPVGFVRQADARAADRADPHLAPAHPHVRADVRLPQHPPGRRAVPARPASSGATRPAWISPSAVARGPRCRSSSSRERNGTTACRPTCSDGGRGGVGPAPRRVPAERIFEPLGMTETDFCVPADGPIGSPRSTCRTR